MNYIYDILLDFHENLYEFYEWNESDFITHVRKIPVFKLDTITVKAIKNYQIRVESDFLKKVENKTEIFVNKGVKTITYACIISDGLEVIALQLKSDGWIQYRSKLLLEEEAEVIEVCERLEETPFSYQQGKAIHEDPFKTRKEKEYEKFILRELHKLAEQNQEEKLRYLYFECFNKKASAKDDIYRKIENALKKDWDYVAPRLYDFFKLISTSK